MSKLNRFSIGIFGGLIMPIVQLYKNGINIDSITFMSALGSLIPIIIVSLAMGIYAVIIENKEDNTRRLFKTCILLPGALLMLFSGKPGDFNKLYAKNDIKIVCYKKSDIRQGINGVINSLLSKPNIKYYQLSNKKPNNNNNIKYIMINEQKYYIIGEYTQKPKSGIIYNISKCKKE